MDAASDPLEGSVRQKAAIVSPVGESAPLPWVPTGTEGTLAPAPMEHHPCPPLEHNHAPLRPLAIFSDF